MVWMHLSVVFYINGDMKNTMKSLTGVAIAGTFVAAVIVIAAVYLVMNGNENDDHDLLDDEKSNHDLIDDDTTSMIGLYALYEVTDNVLDYVYSGIYKATIIDATDTHLLWEYEFDIDRRSLLMHEPGYSIKIRKETITNWVPIGGGSMGIPGAETTIDTPYFGNGLRVLPYVDGKSVAYVGVDDGVLYRMTTPVSVLPGSDVLIFNLKETNMMPT